MCLKQSKYWTLISLNDIVFQLILSLTHVYDLKISNVTFVLKFAKWECKRSIFIGLTYD